MYAMVPLVESHSNIFSPSKMKRRSRRPRELLLGKWNGFEEIDGDRIGQVECVGQAIAHVVMILAMQTIYIYNPFLTMCIGN